MLIVDPWHYFSMLYMIRYNMMHPFNSALPGTYGPVRVTRGALSHIGTLMRLLAVEPCSTAGLLFPSQCRSRTILPTPYSMVRDWRGLKSRAIFFIDLSCSIPTIVFYYFSLSLLYVYMLVLWGWGLRTDRVYITLSQPCTADLFK